MDCFDFGEVSIISIFDLKIENRNSTFFDFNRFSISILTTLSQTESGGRHVVLGFDFSQKSFLRSKILTVLFSSSFYVVSGVPQGHVFIRE